MKKILLALLVISSTVYGQTDDSTKYIYYRTQYGSRMPRYWADSVIHLPFIDTAQLIKPDGFKARPGAIVCRPQDSLLYRWNGDKWYLFGSSDPVTIYTFSNGLTQDGTTVKLGGFLGENTTIDGDFGNSMIFQNLLGFTVRGSSFSFEHGTGMSIINGVSGGQSFNALDINHTWNTSGNPTALNVNVTNTASGATAKLFDLSVGGTSLFNVGKTGAVKLAAAYGSGGITGTAIHALSVDASGNVIATATPVNIPNDYTYRTSSAVCIDTSFTNSAGFPIGYYEKIILPQFTGLRVRVSAGGLVLSDNPIMGDSWYYSFNNVTGELRIYSGGTCEQNFTSTESRIVQGY